MKNRILLISLASLILFLPKQAIADELSELKAQFIVMQKQMQAMQDKIDGLQSSGVAAAPAGQAAVDSNMLERVSLLEEQLERSKGGLSQFTDRMELHGSFELEYVDSEFNDSVEEKEAFALVDDIVLEFEFHATEDIDINLKLQFNEDSNVVADEYYFEFNNLPFNSEIKLGKDDRIYKPDRLTNRYPLAGNAFYKDELVGFFYETEHYPFYGRFSWTQGLELDDKSVGEDDNSDNFNLIQDDTRKSKFNGFNEYTIALGYKEDFGDFGAVDVLGFALTDELSPDDVSFLQGAINDYDSADARGKVRYGGSLDYTWNDYRLRGFYVEAFDGTLKRVAYYVEPSIEFEVPFEWWTIGKKNRLLVRYDIYKVKDVRKTFAAPTTWDRLAVTMGLRTDFLENLYLLSEYTIDGENTNEGGVNNNQLVFQLRYVW